MKYFIPLYLLLPLLTLSVLRTGAQTPDTLHRNRPPTPGAPSLAKDTLPHKYTLFSYDPNNQLDLVDLARSVLKGHHAQRKDTVKQKAGKLQVSALPAAGYTLQTGFAGVVSSNFAFYTSDSNQNLSNVLTSITYSQYNQIIFPVQANIWTKNNKYNIITDWRYLRYPSMTYGLGGNTSTDSGYNINYGYLRLHQAIMQHVAKDLYLGLGYDLDYFWNIQEIDPPRGKTDFETYGLTKTATSSGVSAHFLYDSRRNSINPDNGNYLSIIYQPNFTFLGSDNNWSSLILDGRKYIPVSVINHDILAFWTYDWFTLGDGHPPYLLLPSTGWDPYSNTGRGYIQGRYRSLNMLYLESEYRFPITPNGLLGGVLFANAESFTEPGSDRYEYIEPGYGLGIRISLNKFSRTNLCIDYGWGSHGSSGFFVNLGEVF